MKKEKIKIRQKDSPVLRERARDVSLEEIRTGKIKGVIKKMREALYEEEDGVAIAAPQIGVSLRIFVVKGSVLDMLKNGETELEKESSKQKAKTKDLVFINPEIIKTSRKKNKLEEGCLSVRWLYGHVERKSQVTVKGFDERGQSQERGAAGLLAQIFQHEIDHLNGILFTDKAEGLREIPPAEGKKNSLRFVFFGSSRFSQYVLEELEATGLHPVFKVTKAKEPLPLEKLKKLKADIFIVASFGKILSKEVLELPKKGTLNVHPSLLPNLRGATPIQSTILGRGEPGVTIIKMDEEVDHGPIIAQAKVPIKPWPDYYSVVEEKLGRVGGQILGAVLPKYIIGEIKEAPQKHDRASYTKLIKKTDGLLDLKAPAEENLRKVLAYDVWPGTFFFHQKKNPAREIRVTVKRALVQDGEFLPLRVVPEGKREMNWADFLHGN